MVKEREEKADSLKVNVFLKHSGHGRGGNVGVASIQMEVYLCNQIEKVEGIFFIFFPRVIFIYSFSPSFCSTFSLGSCLVFINKVSPAD